MVRLLRPTEGMRIYDPCVGSGGMLILSKEYVEEHGGNSRNLRLYGQDNNGGVWAMCKMNMILHGIPDADIRNDDSLENPQHLDGGELMRFDRVISNPPFSQNYSRLGLKFPERFHYGFCPEAGKKADLMFAQHMNGVLRANGMMATVMPHGVLFRGGAEQQIRKGFLDDDLLEAVIGLPPNLFYGTGIPACILVMRAKGAKPADRQGKVLFINADAEFFAGRAQYYVRPEHVEKIVSTFEAFADVPGYATVVTRAELAENEDNLNIRRYADNAPPPEPQDVRAHLLGGVPKAEVEAKFDLFAAHGFGPWEVFVERDVRYFDFAPHVTDRRQIRAIVEASPGVHEREQGLHHAFNAWWTADEAELVALASGGNLMTVRARLIASFGAALQPVGLLDRYKVDGAIASWWSENQYDFKTIASQGFAGLVDGWVSTIRGALEDSASNGATENLLDHKLVTRLLPNYLDELADAETKVSELSDQLDAALKPAEEDEAEVGEGLLLADEEIRNLKRDLAAARKVLKTLRDRFVARLIEARGRLTDDECRRLVLDTAREELVSSIGRYVLTHRQTVTLSVEDWWDKYADSLDGIEERRDSARRVLSGVFRDLAYA